MATSSIEDVPRSLEFLFSRDRLNVAIARAMCLGIMVASPRLLESHARTIDQMRLINVLCRFVEIAEEQARSRVSVPGCRAKQRHPRLAMTSSCACSPHAELRCAITLPAGSA
jgi:septum formation topological specificity factor MinE